MAPTRELAAQVAREFETIVPGNRFSVLCVYGGVPYDHQCNTFRAGVDIVVGTPGRLIDHIEKGTLKLGNLDVICLDEADQMLDIGFKDDMDKMLKMAREQRQETENELQVLLFSATLPEWIQTAIRNYMNKDHHRVDLIGNQRLKASETVKHYCVPSHWSNRANILGDIVSVYGKGNNGRTIIFVETKGEANELCLNDKLKDSQVIHGDIAQKQREISLQGFREGKVRVLIATNVCARGIDIPEVDLVINSEPPSDVETFVHRSGRTGRAGKSGVCVTFYKLQQEYMINNIAKRTGVNFNRIGAPQPGEIVAARASQTVEELIKVHPVALDYFQKTATEVLEGFKGDHEKAIKACLAMICNTVQPLPPRSLLSSNEGMYTLLFRTEQPIRNPGYVKAILQRSYPGITYDDTRGWRMTKDEMGCVVDIGSDKVEVKENGDIYLAGNIWSDSRGISLEIPKVVPELKEQPQQQQTNQSYGRFGGNQGGYQRSGNAGRGRGGASGRGRGNGRGGYQRR